jgi:TonB dependent receptor
VTPGQAGENLSGASTFNPRGASNFNALGHQANTNGWLIDGIDNNEYTFNTVIITPSVESVREFKVLTGVFSAEFGRGAGVVSVSTKSGSNEFHGTAFEFYRDEKYDARNFFVAKLPTLAPKPPLDRNQFGGAIGGPVFRNRTFFFFDYAGLRETRGLTFVNTVPTAETRVGDFSNYTNLQGNLIPIYDPLTTRRNPAFDSSRPVTASNPEFLRDQFPGNRIPADRINPVGLNAASIYPLPNAPGNFDNYVTNANRVSEDDNISFRIDHRFGERDSIFFRYNWGNFKLDAPQGQAACCLETPAEAAARFDLGPWVAGIQNTRLKTQGAGVNYTRVITNTLVNELRGGFARTVPFTFQSDFGRQSATSLGIQGINITEFTTGLPNVAIQDFTGLSGGPAFLPVNPKQTHWQIEDSLNWVKGRHSMKFGYRLVDRYASPFTNTDTRSTLTFNRNFTNNPVNNTGGTGLATLLTGYMTTASRGFLLEPYDLRTQEHGLYVQDDLKLSNRITVNAGLRYEIFTAPTEEQNHIVNFDLQNLQLIYAGENGASDTVNLKTRKNNFAPRLGITYLLTEDARTILRTGYGITYFPVAASASNLLGQQVPYTISQNVNPEVNPTNWANVRSIDNPFPPVQLVKPQTTAELNAANPRIVGHGFENETPSAQQWHLGVERQLFGPVMAEVGYIGSAGKHLLMCWNPNEVQPGTGSQAPRRLLQPLSNAATIVQCDPRNRSTFHGLQTRVNQRYTNGMQMLFSYTWGKSLDYGGSAASGGGQTGNPQTVTNLDAGKGPSGFDVRHRAVLSAVYELPWGPNRAWLNQGGLLAAIVGGWQSSTIMTATTGRPFNVSLAAGVNNGAPSWPNRIGSGELEDPTVDLWFNPADFVAPPPNTYGDVGRGILYSPGHLNFDLSLTKRIFFGNGRSNAQLRIESFNLFNHPGFGFPNAAIGSTTVGRITTTVVDNRSMQFAIKFDF